MEMCPMYNRQLRCTRQIFVCSAGILTVYISVQMLVDVCYDEEQKFGLCLHVGQNIVMLDARYNWIMKKVTKFGKLKIDDGGDAAMCSEDDT